MSIAAGIAVSFLVALVVVFAGLAIAKALKSRALARIQAPEPTGHPAHPTHARPRASHLPFAHVATASAAPPVEPTSEAAPDSAALRTKIRDRYIAARFAGIAKRSADLRDFERVIKAARLFFEEDRGAAALELLTLAIEEDPECEATRLALLELAFLLRDASLYSEAAHALRRLNPRGAVWSEVTRLGRALVPGDALFGPPQEPNPREHYGAWPDMPNWLHAPWDLTAEVRAADFHRAVMASPPIGAVLARH